MADLKTLQKDFSKALFDTAEKNIISAIHSDNIAASERLQVHQNNMMITLTEALGSIYPVLKKLVGADFFSYTASEYISFAPPVEGSLIFWGESLTDFLTNFEPASTLGYLPDVARLEWAWHKVFHGQDCEPLDTNSLNTLDKTEMGAVCFISNPNHSIIQSPYPLLAIWQANQDGADNSEDIDINQGGQNILLVRPHLNVLLLSLSDNEVQMLHGLKQGIPLNKVMDSIEGLEQDEASQALAKNLKHGMFTEFYIDKKG